MRLLKFQSARFWIPAFAGLAVILATPSLRSADYIPVVNGNFMTGQWFSDGQTSSMGGNAGIMFVPAVRYSSRLSLLPTIESNYRGTRSAQELAGGNTLFVDTWENAVNFKVIHTLNPQWKIKERVGAGFKWFRETTDESWSNGLYDYRTFSGGVEVENKVGRNATVVAGYDLTVLQFPNYRSLEASQSDALAREYAADKPLDNTIHLASLQINTPLVWAIKSQIHAYYSPRFYSDQTRVEATGLLSSTKREDLLTGGLIALERPLPSFNNSALISGLSYGYSKMDSNQNHYDANQTYFVRNFYDYTQNRFAGSLTLGFGRLEAGPMTLNTGLSYTRREYSNRAIQSGAGAYLTEKLHMAETAVSLGFSYPVSKSLRMRMSSSYAKSASNNQYEDLYRYNYKNSNYLFGFTYDY